MKKMSYAEAIREGMSIRMREDPSVLLFGEDVGAFGGCFGVTAGMFDEFGDKRVRDTPISEGAIIGAAVGSAATGLRPIAELMFCDFLTVGMDQLVNQAAKMRYILSRGSCWRLRQWVLIRFGLCRTPFKSAGQSLKTFPEMKS